MAVEKYKVLQYIVENKSISEAAKKLGYSQSAVSKILKELEEEWNLPLIKRNKKGAKPTSELLSILPQIKKLSLSMEDLNFAVSSVQGKMHGILRVGSFSSVSSSILPEILKNFSKDYPGIQIQLVHGEYADIAKWLSEGSIDCGFLGSEEAKKFYAKPVFKDSLVAVLPKDHPKAKEKKYPIKDIANESFISLEEKSDYDFLQFFDQEGITPKIHYEVENDHVLLSMVEKGLGISFVYETLLKPMRFNIQTMPLDKTKKRTVCIACASGNKASTLGKLFVEKTSEYLAFNMEKKG